MKRRELLIATTGSLLVGAPSASMAMPKFEIRSNGSAAALLPLRVARGSTPSALIQGVQIGGAFPDPGATATGSLSLDLLMIDGRTPILVYAWQQTRVRGARVSTSSRVFMPFIDARPIDLRVTVRQNAPREKGSIETVWDVPLTSGGTYLLATQRRSTQLPPLPTDVRWSESTGLVVPDTAGHDFDAVLLTTV